MNTHKHEPDRGLFFRISILTMFLASGSANLPKERADLSLRYHHAESGLTLLLPVSWRGFSACIQQWDAQMYSPAEDKSVSTGHGSMITLRHPEWKTSAAYQAIPILVFTRAQWRDLHQGKLWPSVYAGGVMDELWHNGKHVFGINSRYNADESLTHWNEVASIIERNRAANSMPRLYAE